MPDDSSPTPQPAPPAPPARQHARPACTTTLHPFTEDPCTAPADFIVTVAALAALAPGAKLCGRHAREAARAVMKHMPGTPVTVERLGVRPSDFAVVVTPCTLRDLLDGVDVLVSRTPRRPQPGDEL